MKDGGHIVYLPIARGRTRLNVSTRVAALAVLAATALYALLSGDCRCIPADSTMFPYEAPPIAEEASLLSSPRAVPVAARLFPQMKLKQYQETEAEIQGRLKDWLEKLGYTVLATDRHRRRCNQCGKTDDRPDAMNAGIPDLLVTHWKWPEGCWLGIEMKRDAKAKVRPAQQQLADQGRVIVCWDDRDGVELVKAFHKAVTA